jgi:intracellular septation protein
MKSIVEIIPLIGFLIAYKQYGIINATIVLVLLSLISIILLYIKERKVAKMPLFSALVVVFFGALTILFDNPIFIKLKPTIINIIFAITLLIANYKGKPLLKMFLEKSLTMNDKAWQILSRRYAILFIFLAILNEIVWRNFSESIWVNFKVFGILGISMLFIISQIPFMNKNSTSQ